MGKKKKPSDETQGPYRGGETSSDAGESDGLVGDLVRQFADPYAFFRELVQNAIDAGATNVSARVVLTREADTLRARISVTDDGSGMSQEVVEEDLVVLFRSTKEDRGDTIGKFGIGFVSVLAIAPTLVVVSTCTGDAARHVLHLHPDRTYDLYREPSGTRGTTVTLHVVADGDGSELVARSEAALRKWCGHAGVPIHWTVVRANDAAPSEEARIDRPLDIDDALVSVHATSHDGETEAIVALVPETGRLAAYYNRGLLLHASKDRGTRASIAFKVMNPRLSHTLSREDVRLDDAHERAVGLVQHTLTGPLTESVIEAIGDAARDHVAGDATAGGRWLALVTAARAAELAIDPRRMEVPLLAPIARASTARSLGEHGPFLVGGARDALVDLLAARGIPVIDRRLATTDAERQTLDALLTAYGGSAPVAPSKHHTALTVAGKQHGDGVLLERVATLLGIALRKPSSVCFVDAIGGASRLSFVLSGELPQLAHARSEEADPFRLAMRPPLALRSSHPVVTLARAHPDPVLAADVLARAVMIDRDLVTEARSAALVEASLRALFAGDGR